MVEPLEARMQLSLTTQLVADINTGVSDVTVGGTIIEVGSIAYFVGSDEATGGGLWKSDGTAAGTGLVKDITPGNLTNVNGTLFFTSDDGVHGAQLWKSDGTEAGTVPLMQITQPPFDEHSASFATVNTTLFFVANDGKHGYELWKSDGTAAGTVLVKDIFADGFFIGRGPDSLTNVNGTLYFADDNGSTGEELWKSDGTEAGTVLVRDIQPGPDGSSPTNLTNIGGTLFFTATRPHGGSGSTSIDYELWKSDGTSTGTVVVKQLETAFNGFHYPTVHYLTNVSGTLFFTHAGSPGVQLWKSDGTETGTVLVKDNITGSGSSYYSRLALPGLTNVNGTLLFRTITPNFGSSSDAIDLWKSDGTTSGTAIVESFTATNVFAPFQLFLSASVNGFYYFTGADSTNGAELWKSDGTQAGTALVKDITPGPANTFTTLMTNVNGTLFFAPNGALWTSNGTGAGTVKVTRVGGASNPGPVEMVNGTAYFDATDSIHGRQLWKSDGTALGTTLVRDINTGPDYFAPRDLTNVNGTLFFLFGDATHPYQLWKSDGTEAGTGHVKDLSSYGYQSLVNVNGTLYFSDSASADSKPALWKLDASGTVPETVKIFNGGPPALLTNVNGKLFFAAEDNSIYGDELWTSDGTETGTVLVRDIWQSSNGSYPSFLTNVGGTLFFDANDGCAAHCNELWKSDGTTAGTVLVKDIQTSLPGFESSSDPRNLTNVNGTLFFTANDGIHGIELWKSNGTEAGTVLVKDILAGESSSNLASLTNVNGTLFFTANDGVNGVELWKTDGTPNGTVMIKDIKAGADGSGVSELVNFGGALFFSANDGSHGYELWKSDGTAAGTLMAKDIAPGFASSGPFRLSAQADKLFFSADDGTHGRELWMMREDNIPNVAPSFSEGPNQFVKEEDGMQSVADWATASPGPPEEDGQTIAFTLTSDNASLFAVQPAIDTTGRLSYKPAPNATGIATVTVVLVDSGGMANGGVDTSMAQTFNITITKKHIWHNSKPWTNGMTGLDVNDDNHVAANDAAAVVNYLNGFGTFLNGQVPALGSLIGNTSQVANLGGPFGYLDVNGDGFVAASDALAIVNVINANQGGEGEPGNGESDFMTVLAIDVALQPKRRQ